MIFNKRSVIEKDIKDLIDNIESDHVKKVNELILSQIQEEKDAYQEALKTIEMTNPQKNYEKISDKFIWFLGSWNFIFMIILLHVIWWYMSFIPQTQIFDPFPFNKLYFLLWFISLIQWPLIILSQNRAKIANEKRNQSDYLVNLKTQIEMSNLHKKIDLVVYDQIQTLLETQKIQFEYLEKIQKKLDIS